MILMPWTRDTAPSITEVSFRSTVSGEAPSKVVSTETTGWSTCGSSRTSMPFKRREAGNDDQRVDDQREDRPANEKRGKTRRAPGLRHARPPHSFPPPP